VTASEGLRDAIDSEVSIGSLPEQVLGAFVGQDEVFVADAAWVFSFLGPGVRSLELGSALIQPVVDQSRALGVLIVAWETPVEDAGSTPLSALRPLASESAIAVGRAELQADLENTARTDPLTRLPNRRAWEEQLPRELGRAGRYEHKLTVAVLDIDHFKAFNDAFGHQAGDALLTRAAEAWSAHLRAADLLARCGGDESCLLLPDSDVEQALENHRTHPRHHARGSDLVGGSCAVEPAGERRRPVRPRRPGPLRGKGRRSQSDERQRGRRGCGRGTGDEPVEVGASGVDCRP
jgi:GGDEF domain-containing protein